MKKQKTKIVLALLMALVMFASLASCATGGKTAEQTATSPAASETAKSAADSTQSIDVEPLEIPSDDFDYSAQFKSIGTTNFFNVKAFEDNGFYVVSTESAEDGSYMPRIYFVGTDGKTSQLNGYTPMQTIKDTQGRSNFYSCSTLEGITVYNGGLAAVEEVFAGWEDSESGYTSENSWFVRILDKNGSEKACYKIAGENGEEFDGSSIKAGNDGKIYVLCDSGVCIINKEGIVESVATCQGYITELVRLKDGRIAAAAWIDGDYVLMAVDDESAGFADSYYRLPENTTEIFDGSGDYDFYYTANINCYGASIASGAAAEMFNWAEIGIVAEDISGFATQDGKTYYGLINTRNEALSGYVTELAEITRGKAAAGKTLTLASAYAGYELQKMVADFNRANSKAAIRIECLNADSQGNLLSGINGVDIIDLNGISYGELASSGIAEDITAYLSKGGIQLMPNVLAALQANGGIYAAIPGFGISTVAGNADVVGNSSTWTYDVYNNLLVSMQGVCPFGMPTTREGLLWTGVSLNLPTLIDWSNLTCDFTGATFLNAIKLAASVPEIPDETATGVLEEVTLYTCNDALSAGNELGNNISFVGYPTDQGGVSALVFAPGLAISSTCKDKDAAWEFVRGIFADEYQENMWCFPSVASAFEKKLAAAKTEQYAEDGTRIPRAIVLGSDGQSVEEVYALSDADAEKLTSVVRSTTRALELNEDIYDIVLSAVSGYFSGAYTAEEAATEAQEQVSVYLVSLK